MKHQLFYGLLCRHNINSATITWPVATKSFGIGGRLNTGAVVDDRLSNSLHDYSCKRPNYNYVGGNIFIHKKAKS